MCPAHLPDVLDGPHGRVAGGRHDQLPQAAAGNQVLVHPRIVEQSVGHKLGGECACARVSVVMMRAWMCGCADGWMCGCVDAWMRKGSVLDSHPVSPTCKTSMLLKLQPGKLHPGFDSKAAGPSHRCEQNLVQPHNVKGGLLRDGDGVCIPRRRLGGVGPPVERLIQVELIHDCAVCGQGLRFQVFLCRFAVVCKRVRVMRAAWRGPACNEARARTHRSTSKRARMPLLHTRRHTAARASPSRRSRPSRRQCRYDVSDLSISPGRSSSSALR